MTIINCDLTIPVGSTLVIDFVHRTAFLDGVDVFDKISPYAIELERNCTLVVDAETEGALNGAVLFTERYL